MQFSIVMPVLNGGRFLADAIDSVQAQSHERWELLICDGGSADGSLELIERRAAEDPRIKCVSQADAGIYDAVVRGFNRSQGEVFGWLGADDLYAPWALATVAHFMKERGARWVTGLPGAWDHAGRLQLVRPQAVYPRSLIRAGWFHGHLLGFIQQESTFFDRVLFDQLTGEERAAFSAFRLAGDFYLWRRLAHRAQLMATPTLLAGFRIHAENRSRLRMAEYLEEAFTTKPVRLPRQIGWRLGACYRLMSALACEHAASKALERLSEEPETA